MKSVLSEEDRDSAVQSSWGKQEAIQENGIEELAVDPEQSLLNLHATIVR